MIVQTCGVQALQETILEFNPHLVISCASWESRLDLSEGWSARVVFARVDDIYNQQLIAYKNAIRAALDSAKGEDHVLVHCQHGLSRSAAIACAVLWQHEPSAVDRWLEQHPDAQPNPLLLLLADEILDADFDLLRRCRQRYKGRML